MNKFLIILNIYLILEGINYISHIVQYEKISEVKNHKKHKKDKKKTKKCAKIIKNDFINHINDIPNCLDLYFNGRTRSLSKSNVHDLLTKTIYSPYHDNIKSSNHICDIITKYEEKTNIKLPETSNILFNQDNNIKVWYKPLPIILAFEAILMYSDIMMFSEGFTKTTYDNGLVIWYKEGTTNKSNAILFLHAVTGGLIVQSQFIKKIPNTHTIILPEIPGIAFGNRVFIPPTIREISEEIINFAIKIQIEYLQLISHSFGGNITSCIINNYVDKLEQNNIKIINTTLVEPIIFLPSLFSVYNLLNAELNTSDLMHCIQNNKTKILSYILIYRDIYAQYYSKCLTMTDVLMGTTKYEKNNCINIILAENDELYSTSECVHYLTSKKYNCNLIVLKDKSHGDFCFNEKTHEIVIKFII